MATRIAASEALLMAAALNMNGGGPVSRLAVEAKLHASETAPANRGESGCQPLRSLRGIRSASLSGHTLSRDQSKPLSMR